MKRRDFIKRTGAFSTMALVGGITLPSFIAKKQRHITILHTNDTHSHIEPFKANHNRFPNGGGVARRATLIEQIRQENENTLLLDAGDIFQGTPYFNYFGGELEFKLMSILKYDVATIGNHDFDNSIEGLYKQLPNAKFDFVSANYDFKNTVLDTHVKPYKILHKDGLKIGVFGLGIELEGLVGKKMYKETGYLNPIEITQDITRQLKQEEQCDLIICLSHLGYYYKSNPDKVSDLTLAKATKDIDLIIGGHTHTFLPKPTIVKNADGKNTLVNQVGAYGVNLGRIDFYFDEDATKTAKGTTILV
ncbi:MULTISPECIES: bifunctional UDP-sugar hydrolase/5'-nucleotidase [Polaribacter]|uniref:Metallophosphatase n=1 Tax=Polaribacter sejongensis TaxID=985043 RepID=A0AAJ1VHR5_9FLAO|nr:MULTISPECIES: metallophosphatase [Polaribacter]AUC23310.1 metallophosphatase [Polaribacter sejongensis]MDN3620664.1 metallophosphatase [Polaribacter undariae]UWD32480.1 metallophosphatase [Polaribacter undariae]